MEVSEEEDLPGSWGGKWFHSLCLAALLSLPLPAWLCASLERAFRASWHYCSAEALDILPLLLSLLASCHLNSLGSLRFLFSGGKFHLTLSSGTRIDIRFVDDEVLLSEFNKRGTMKRLQLLSKSSAPITEFICIYKWHISGGSPHPSRCTVLPQKTC